LTEGESVEDSAESFYNRGLNLVGFGGNVRYDRAIAHFTKAIELNPDFAAAFHSRAYAYYSIDDYDHAIADYTKAIQLNPDFAAAFHFIIVV
jgi:tetratricopeptide (TPR) repeat protein